MAALSREPPSAGDSTLSVEELRTLLRIRATPGIGDVRLTALLREHGSAREAWKRLAAERPDTASRTADPVHAARIDHVLATLLQDGRIFVLPAYHPRYPAGLLDLHDPPPVLFAQGDIGLLGEPGVAVVGTRACTEYGADVARAVATALAAGGATTISGLAHGIDRHAHEAALDADGATVAVIGCGIDVTYPRRHRQLRDRIAAHGLLVSEFMPGEPALPHHFPRRNRIIAALSRAVVVVEAPARSGALITAEHALDLGREVIAVPGPIGRRTSAGTNALIRDGATILEAAEDVVELTGSRRGRRATDGGRLTVDDVVRGTRAEGDGTEGVASILGDEPRHVDELALAVGLDTAGTLAILLELELEGRARAFAGGRYGRTPVSRS